MTPSWVYPLERPEDDDAAKEHLEKAKQEGFPAEEKTPERKPLPVPTSAPEEETELRAALRAMGAGGGPTLTQQLAAPLSADELKQANTQASPVNAHLRQLYRDTLNAARAANGNPTLPAVEDPYVGGQQRFRDWVMKRGDFAQGEQVNALRAKEAANNEARTNAYLKSMDGNEDARKSRLDLEKEKGERQRLESETRLRLAEEDSKRKTQKQSFDEWVKKRVLEASGARAKQKAEAEQKKAEGKAAEQGKKDTTALRKEFNSQDSVKNYNKVRDAYESLKSNINAGTAASDMSAIYQYMKLMDPGSTVRESEFAAAQNAAGAPDRIANYFSQVKSGTRLNEAQRADFLAQAEKLYTSRADLYGKEAKRYRDLATKAGMAPDDVALELPKAGQGGKTLSAQEQKYLDYARALKAKDPNDATAAAILRKLGLE